MIAHVNTCIKKIFSRGLLFLIALFLQNSITAQYLITSPNYTYTQDFGTTVISASGNNITSGSTNLIGWSYDAPLTGEINILSGSPTNNGGQYSYRLNGLSDRKIGSRASGNAAIKDVYYGVLFQNTSGQTINSFSVSYTGFQLSTGGNSNANINQLTVDYKISNGSMLVDATGAVNIPSLTYSQTQFTTTTSNTYQGIGYPTAIGSGVNSGCIPASAIIPNNSYLLIRWTDLDDTGNDPHLAIDNVEVVFFTNQTVANNTACSFLPIELIDFSGIKTKNEIILNWRVADEKNINYYSIEKSLDGVEFTEVGKIIPSSSYEITKNYTLTDEESSEDILYYRLSTKEKNGNINYYKLIAIEANSNDWDYSTYQKDDNIYIDFKSSIPKNGSVNLYDFSGKILGDTVISGVQTKINIENLATGIYFLRITSNTKTENFKILIQK